MKAAQFIAKRAGLAHSFAGLFGRERPSVQPAASPEPRAKVSYPESVLVIDDDPVFMRTTEMKLNSAGYGLVAAVDSSEAIAALGEHQPRLVLVDVNLPPDVENGGMFAWDGFRLVRWLKGLQNAKQAKFVMISATDSDSSRQQARSCGAVDFLAKPLDYQRVLSFLGERVSS